MMMNIGAAAERSGVPAKTIRYYESVGLIGAAARAANGYRAYAEAEVQTLRFISRARGLGFSVRQVAELLALYRDKGRRSAEVKALVDDHVGAIDRKMAALKSLRATLVELSHKCRGDNRPDCPILDDLADNS